MSGNLPPSFPKWISLGFLFTGLLAYLIFPDFRQWLSEAFAVFSTGELREIQQWLAQYRGVGPYILLGAFIVQMFLFVLPSILVMSLCMLMYGPWWGSFYCFTGIFIASSLAYFIGKSLSTLTIEKLIGQKSNQKMQKFLLKYGFWTVFVFRLSAFLSNDAVSFVAGLVKMNYYRFILATLLGISPLIALLAWVGGQKTESLDTALIIGGIVSLVGLIIFIWLDKRNQQQSED